MRGAVAAFAYSLLTSCCNALGLNTTYDTIILKFDPACSKDGHQTLMEHIVNALSAGRTRTVEDSQSALLEPDQIQRLLSEELERELWHTLRHVSWRDRVQAATESAVDETDAEEVQSYAKRTRARTLRLDRVLHETSSRDREDEILAALHLLAVATLTKGDLDTAKAILRHERSGEIAALLEQLQASGLLVEESAKRRLQSAFSRKSRSQFIVSPRSLEFLDGTKIVHNPVLGERLLNVATLLPCLQSPPTPDRLYSVEHPVDNAEPLEVQRLVANHSDLQKTERIIPVEVLDWDTLEKRMEEERQGGYRQPSVTPVISNQTFYLRYPDDAAIPYSWYLETPTSEDNIVGASITSGWAQIIRDIEFSRRPELIHQKEVVLDFDVLKEQALRDASVLIAVMDTGCARHPDLIEQFWRNPFVEGCESESFLGTAPPPDSEEDESEPWYNDCIGFDFAEMKPDPTVDLEVNQHGTAVTGLIGAAGDNQKAVAGVCPFCPIVCLKLSSVPQGDIQLSVILLAINYVLSKGRIQVINQSYGTFGMMYGVNDPEFLAQRGMAEKGRSAVRTAGDNACDIGPESPTNCMGLDWTVVPAGYTVSGHLTVGASEYLGQKTKFTNWGSVVPLYAPGTSLPVLKGDNQTIITEGTAFSAAIVSGIVGLLRSRFGGVSNVEIERVLLATALPFGDHRVVSLQRAVTYLEHYGGQIPELTTTDAPTPSSNLAETLLLQAAGALWMTAAGLL